MKQLFIFVIIGLLVQVAWGQVIKGNLAGSLPIIDNIVSNISKKGGKSLKNLSSIKGLPENSLSGLDFSKTNIVNNLGSIKTTHNIYNGTSIPSVISGNLPSMPLGIKYQGNSNMEWIPPKYTGLNTTIANQSTILSHKTCGMEQCNYNQVNNEAEGVSTYNPYNIFQKQYSEVEWEMGWMILEGMRNGFSSKMSYRPIGLYYSYKMYLYGYQNIPIHINKTCKHIAISFQKQRNYQEAINYWGIAFQSTLKRYFFSSKGLNENDKYIYSADLINYLENYYSAINDFHYSKQISNNTVDSYYSTVIGNAFTFASISKGIVLNDILENKKNVDSSIIFSSIETNLDLIKRKYGVNHYLNVDEVAVEIVKFYDSQTNNNAYVALIANNNNYKYIPLSIGNNIEDKWFNHYLSNIKNKHTDSLSYIRYWKPIADAIGNAKTVYISNDGIYHKLNLNTLRDADGKYVIEKWNIHVLASTRDLIKRKRTETIPENPTAMLVGNPSFSLSFQEMAKKAKEVHTTPEAGIYTAMLRGDDRGRFTPLKGAEAEINAIDKLLQANGWRTAKYLNGDAIEERMKVLPVQSPTVLSIATHGFFYENAANNRQSFNDNVMYKSGLYLAGAKTSNDSRMKPDSIDYFLHPKSEDGIFYAQEAATLNLDNTELVVLSACETGLGAIQNGEGVYGLQRAFRMAGAKNILMSLWKVEDNTTQELMTTFFTYWIEKKMSKYDAFRQAQLDMLAKYKTPLYWGGFILMER